MLLAISLIGGTAMAVEEPEFITLKKEGEFALREYAPVVVAQTTVEGAFEDVSNQGFRLLAGYIFGGNQGSKKISMTAPVGVANTDGEKIKMTAPVGVEKSDSKSWRVTFTMPKGYTLETLPKPNDARVILKQSPAQKMAAFEYSGTWSKERYEERKLKLEKWIRDNQLKATGEAVFARYDPPWIPWFLRRNEILIPVAGP